MGPTTDFTTNCYEMDWQLVLSKSYLRVVVDRCCHPLSVKRLVINNVLDRSLVEAAAREAVNRGDLDEYLFADDHSEAALDFFGISKASFNGGYFYSIAELVALYASKADYLLYYMGDSFPARRHGWIAPAIEAMERRPDFVVANPLWNGRIREARSEADDEEGSFFAGYGFSDQCFLAKTSVFRARIYGETNPASERYPAYGGESFEKRVDAYMRNHGLKRLTHRSDSYIHQNIPARGFKRRLRQIRPLLSQWM